MKINISNDILAEIGKVIVVSTYIEDSLAEIIGRIVIVGGKTHELGLIMTAELSFKQKISILDSLLLLTLGEKSSHVAEFNKIKPLLHNAQEERNIVAHSTWAKQSDTKTTHTVLQMKSTAKQKKGLQIKHTSLDLEALQAISEKIGIAYVELCKFELYFRDENGE